MTVSEMNVFAVGSNHLQHVDDTDVGSGRVYEVVTVMQRGMYPDGTIRVAPGGDRTRVRRAKIGDLHPVGAFDVTRDRMESEGALR